MAFYTDTILGDWINNAYKWAASRHKWPFTERRDNLTTWSSATEEYSYPTDFKSDSIRLMQVGGKRIQKINFEDYQIYREEQSTGTARIFTDLGRTYWINPNVDTSGTISVWGQYLVAGLDNSVPGNTTVFSNAEEEGNEAIVEEVLSYVNTREKSPTGLSRRKVVSQGIVHHDNAITLLEEIWKRIQDEQFGYQTKDRGWFKRFDVLRGATRDELIKRDQWF